MSAVSLLAKEPPPRFAVDVVDAAMLASPIRKESMMVAKILKVEPPTAVMNDTGFWMIILSLCVTSRLAAIDLTSVSTALPTIIEDLKGDSDFVWVASAYTLASKSIIPLSGNIATIFGRRISTLSLIFLFAVGSAVTASAPIMPGIIAGRTLQGLGGGGILVLAEIVISDLVSLRERGVYIGIISLVWAFAAAVGPPKSSSAQADRNDPAA